jgi:hypothetical protein
MCSCRVELHCQVPIHMHKNTQDTDALILFTCLYTLYTHTRISQSAAKTGVSGEKTAVQQQAKADADTKEPEGPEAGGKEHSDDGEEGSAEGSAEDSAERSDDDDADNDCCVLCKGSESSTKVSSVLSIQYVLLLLLVLQHLR